MPLVEVVNAGSAKWVHDIDTQLLSCRIIQFEVDRWKYEQDICEQIFHNCIGASFIKTNPLPLRGSLTHIYMLVLIGISHLSHTIDVMHDAILFCQVTTASIPCKKKNSYTLICFTLGRRSSCCRMRTGKWRRGKVEI